MLKICTNGILSLETLYISLKKKKNIGEKYDIIHLCLDQVKLKIFWV